MQYSFVQQNPKGICIKFSQKLTSKIKELGAKCKTLETFSEIQESSDDCITTLCLFKSHCSSLDDNELGYFSFCT